ncbi:MAG: hypothetical protein WBG37_10055 [Desulfobacterales bacterium]
MVIQSQLHDWLLIVYGKRYAYSNFKEDYDSAKAYFGQNPGQLGAFDTAFENAIVKIEKYTPDM